MKYIRVGDKENEPEAQRRYLVKRKNSNKLFWKIFLSELALIVFFGSMCAGIYVENKKAKAEENVAETKDAMDNVYVEMPNGEEVPWNKSPYSKIVIRLSGKPSVVANVKHFATSKNQAKKTVIHANDIELLVMQLAEEARFSNVRLLKKIIKCESGWKSGIVNWDTYDYGLWQINLYHNPEVSKQCALDATCSTRWAINEIQSGNIWKWKASRYCWGDSI